VKRKATGIRATLKNRAHQASQAYAIARSGEFVNADVASQCSYYDGFVNGWRAKLAADRKRQRARKRTAGNSPEGRP
jgi:hypothetical protein